MPSLIVNEKFEKSAKLSSPATEANRRVTGNHRRGTKNRRGFPAGLAQLWIVYEAYQFTVQCQFTCVDFFEGCTGVVRLGLALTPRAGLRDEAVHMAAYFRQIHRPLASFSAIASGRW
jgi:hypothetical protein